MTTYNVTIDSLSLSKYMNFTYIYIHSYYIEINYPSIPNIITITFGKE